jgi:hypothetical protein
MRRTMSPGSRRAQLRFPTWRRGRWEGHERHSERIGYGLDKLGYKGAAESAYGMAHDLANPFQIGDAVEKIAPTPDTTSGR